MCTVGLLSRSLTRILQSYKASLGARKNRRRPLFSMLMAITLALVGCAAQCRLLVFSNLFPIYIFCQQQLQFSCNQILTENNIVNRCRNNYWCSQFLIPYVRHYNPRLVYFLPHFSLRFIL